MKHAKKNPVIPIIISIIAIGMISTFIYTNENYHINISPFKMIKKKEIKNTNKNSQAIIILKEKENEMKCLETEIYDVNSTYYDKKENKFKMKLNTKKLTEDLNKAIKVTNISKRHDASPGEILRDDSYGKFILGEKIESNKIDLNIVPEIIKELEKSEDKNIQIDLTKYYINEETTEKDRTNMETKINQFNEEIDNLKLNEVYDIPVETIFKAIDTPVNINQLDIQKLWNDDTELRQWLNTTLSKNASTQITYTATDGTNHSLYNYSKWKNNITFDENEAINKIKEAINNNNKQIEINYESTQKEFTGKRMELSITAQHLKLINEDGSIALETDVVTGDPKGPTPTGLFNLWYKERNATLKGNGFTGLPYAAPVAYWMPLWEGNGVGFHDANWQSSFGGTRYLNGYGSHGCINVSPSIMPSVYEFGDEDTPILIY